MRAPLLWTRCIRWIEHSRVGVRSFKLEGNYFRILLQQVPRSTVRNCCLRAMALRTVSHKPVARSLSNAPKPATSDVNWHRRKRTAAVLLCHPSVPCSRKEGRTENSITKKNLLSMRCQCTQVTRGARPLSNLTESADWGLDEHRCVRKTPSLSSRNVGGKLMR